MSDFHKAPSSSRPKTNSLLLQVVLRSIGCNINLAPKLLTPALATCWQLPFEVRNYNEASQSNSWCCYQTTNLPAIIPFKVTKPFWWELPRPSTVITEFDSIPVPRHAYSSLRPAELSVQIKDACTIWRLLTSMITGNTNAHRSQYSQMPIIFLDNLYGKLRGKHEHANSPCLSFLWNATSRRQAPATIDIKHCNPLVAAVASVWPGIAITYPVAGHAVIGPVYNWVSTTFNPVFAFRAVYDAGRGMYGMSVLNKQISDGEYHLLCAWILLTCLLEDIYISHSDKVVRGEEQYGVASTTRITSRAINFIKCVVRVVVNDFESKAGQLVQYNPTTYKLE